MYNQPVNCGSKSYHQAVKSRSKPIQPASKLWKQTSPSTGKQSACWTSNQPADENAIWRLCASEEQTKEPHKQPADQPRNYVPKMKPHNQPAHENATSQLHLRTDEGTTQPDSRQKCNLATMCQQRTDGGTTQPASRQNATSPLCASKEQTEEPHNQPADQPRNYVLEKNRTSPAKTGRQKLKGT
jgi:hypothetical protein